MAANRIMTDYQIKVLYLFVLKVLNLILILRPNKQICVFMVTCQKNLGSVGPHSFFYFIFLLSAKPEIVVLGSDSGISFSKFPVSRHLLKLFYDELRSFSTFFALNFDKKLAVE